jgi:replicative DNA helicase
MTCFLVDNNEHLFLMNDYIVTHNTRFMVGNACALSLPKIEGDKVIYRDDMQKILFVATEMQADEIQTMIMSYVSGVNERAILYNEYTIVERILVEQAIKIIEQYGDNFIIEYIPDPSISHIRAMMTRYILNEDISHIYYDYIFSSPGLLSEFRDIKVREDVALMMLANTLKEIASTYNIYMQSATQLNDKWEKNLQRNQNQLRGAKAIADKVDIGMISIKLEECPDELEIIQTIIEQAGLRTPNVVIDLYKNRRGQYSSVKILRTFDYGTCRVMQDVCLMTNSHKIIENYNVLEYETIERDLLDMLTEVKQLKAKAEEDKKHE